MNESKTIGRCTRMCPAKEVELRERENLLHSFELAAIQRSKGYRCADWEKCVKEYSRPTVGKQEVDPDDIRPADVLIQTTDYLVDSVCTLAAPWSTIYEFVFDRLRAVRQDLVIQEAEGREAVYILEHAVRFHMLSDYRLCREGPAVFDQKINDQHTQECLKRLINLYTTSQDKQGTSQCLRDRHSHRADTEPDTSQVDFEPGTSRCWRDRHSHGSDSQSGTSQVNVDFESSTSHSERDRHRLEASGQLGTGGIDFELGTSMCPGHQRSHGSVDQPSTSRVDFETGTSMCGRDGLNYGASSQAEFEATYLLFNLGEKDALKHYYSLSPQLRYHRDIRLAYNLSLAYLTNNWVKVLKLLGRVQSPVHLCAVHRHFPTIQWRALRCLSTGYSSKNQKFPLDKLTELLWLNTDTETQSLCERLGVVVVGTTAQFQKLSFNAEAKVERSHCDTITSRLRQFTVPDILHGNLHGNSIDSLSVEFSSMCNT